MPAVGGVVALLRYGRSAFAGGGSRRGCSILGGVRRMLLCALDAELTDPEQIHQRVVNRGRKDNDSPFRGRPNAGGRSSEVVGVIEGEMWVEVIGTSWSTKRT